MNDDAAIIINVISLTEFYPNTKPKLTATGVAWRGKHLMRSKIGNAVFKFLWRGVIIKRAVCKDNYRFSILTSY